MSAHLVTADAGHVLGHAGGGSVLPGVLLLVRLAAVALLVATTAGRPRSTATGQAPGQPERRS